MRHPAWVDSIFSWFLETFLSSYLLYIRSSHMECLSLLPCRTIHLPGVTPTAVWIPSIQKAVQPFLCQEPPFACAELHSCWSCISSNSSSGSHFRNLWRWRRPGRSETCLSTHILCSGFRMSLTDLVIPFWANCHKGRQFLGHIAIGHGVVHSLEQPHLRSIP